MHLVRLLQQVALCDCTHSRNSQTGALTRAVLLQLVAESTAANSGRAGSFYCLGSCHGEVNS